MSSKKIKGFIQSAQKYSPSSKYLGFSGVPGVSSQKSIKERAVAAEEQAVATAATEAEAARKQAEIDAQNARDEEARGKIRDAQGGGYAANVLAGGKGLGFGSGARRRLSGS